MERQAANVLFGRGGRNAWTQAPDRCQPARGRVVEEIVAVERAQIGRDRHEQPRIHALEAESAEVRWRHPDDPVQSVANSRRGADDVGPAAKSALPEAVGQHHHRLSAATLLLRKEHATHDRAGAEQAEVALCHALGVNGVGGAIATERQRASRHGGDIQRAVPASDLAMQDVV